jgi:hypothetical protein
MTLDTLAARLYAVWAADKALPAWESLPDHRRFVWKRIAAVALEATTRTAPTARIVKIDRRNSA